MARNPNTAWSEYWLQHLPASELARYERMCLEADSSNWDNLQRKRARRLLAEVRRRKELPAVSQESTGEAAVGATPLVDGEPHDP
jgi:hypothetical protein